MEFSTKREDIMRDTCRHTKRWATMVIAASAGNPKAQYDVGNCYDNGDYVLINYDKAFFWYQLSAEQGYPDAQYSLGGYYQIGRAVKKNNTIAKELYKKAFEGWMRIVEAWDAGGFKGDVSEVANAMYHISNCYDCGAGVKMNDELSVHWFERAADIGFSHWKWSIGRWYVGNGRPYPFLKKDMEKAVYWWKRAAEEGEVAAFWELYDCYRKGVVEEKEDGSTVVIVEKDRGMAKFWKAKIEEEMEREEEEGDNWYYAGDDEEWK